MTCYQRKHRKQFHRRTSRWFYSFAFDRLDQYGWFYCCPKKRNRNQYPGASLCGRIFRCPLPAMDRWKVIYSSFYLQTCRCGDLDGWMEFGSPRILDTVLRPKFLFIDGRSFKHHRIIGSCFFCRFLCNHINGVKVTIVFCTRIQHLGPFKTQFQWWIVQL